MRATSSVRFATVPTTGAMDLPTSTGRPGHRRALAIAALCALGTLAALPAMARAQAGPTGTWHVAKSIPVGGEGFWDYLVVDTAGNRLFISHGTHVVVVDLGRDTIVGDIPNTPGVHGIAIVPEVGRGFTSNGRDSTTTVFDLETLGEIARVNVGGANPDAILYDPFSKRVFTMNGRSADASAIDVATGKVAGQVALGGRPETAVTDGKGHLYINIEDKSEIAEVDPAKLAVLRRWSIAPCEGPSGLAIDVAHERIFSVCDGVMAISDVTAGKLLTTVPIGQGPDGAAFDPGLGLAFSSNGEGSVSVVGPAGAGAYKVVQTVTTQRGARTIALDPRTHRLYLSTAEYQAAAPGERRPAPVPGSFKVLVLER